MNLLKPISTNIVDDVEFSITKIYGSKKDKTITVTFLYENKSSESRDFSQCQEAYAIDARGNQLQTYKVYVASNKNMRAEKIKYNIPIKGNFVFKTEETDFPILRILKILVYPKDNISNPKEFFFGEYCCCLGIKKFRFIVNETEFLSNFLTFVNQKNF